MAGVRDCTGHGDRKEAGPCPGASLHMASPGAVCPLDDSALCCPMAPTLFLFSPALNMACHLCSPRQGSRPSARPVPATFQLPPPALTPHLLLSGCSLEAPLVSADPLFLSPFFCPLSSWPPGPGSTRCSNPPLSSILPVVCRQGLSLQPQH